MIFTSSSRDVRQGPNVNSVNIAGHGASNSLRFYWAVNGTSTWHPETVAGKNATYSAPSMTEDRGESTPSISGSVPASGVPTCRQPANGWPAAQEEPWSGERPAAREGGGSPLSCAG